MGERTATIAIRGREVVSIIATMRDGTSCS